MKTRISLSKVLVIFLLPVLWINASGAMKIEVGGTGRISGCIRNAASNQPLGCAAVTLFSASDSSMVAGTITNNDGSFVISMLSAGNYFLEISEPGFEKSHISGLNVQTVLPVIDIGEVQLNPDAGNGKKNNSKKLKNRRS